MAESFAAWFKDSKIVDSNGRPLVVYHGTRSRIETLRPSTGGEFGPGIYLTSDEGTANFYATHVARGPDGPSIMPVYVSMKNPFRVAKTDWIMLTTHRTPRTVARGLMKKGHDGIIGIGINGHSFQIVAWREEQVRSAIGSGRLGAVNDGSISIPISNVFMLNRWGHPLNAQRFEYQVQHGRGSPPVLVTLGTSFEVNAGDYVSVFDPQDDSPWGLDRLKMDPRHPKYFLSDGHHRLRAAQHRGETHIAAEVLTPVVPSYLGPEKRALYMRELQEEVRKMQSIVGEAR